MLLIQARMVPWIASQPAASLTSILAHELFTQLTPLIQTILRQ